MNNPYANTKTAAGSIITLTIGPNQFIDEIEGIEDIENIEDIEETQKEEVSEEGKDVNQDSKNNKSYDKGYLF